MSRLRINLLRAGLVMIGLFLPLAILEFALGRSTPPAQYEPPAPPPDLPAIETMADLSRPKWEGINRGVYYRTNSLGFRGPEPTARPRLGVHRIVIVGDSITMGAGVVEEAAYPALLQGLLNADEPGQFEVFNLGISGLPISRIVARLNRLGLELEPELVIYGLTLNDIEGPKSKYRKSAATQQQNFAKRLRMAEWIPSRALRWLWPKGIVLLDRLSPMSGSYIYDLVENYDNNPEAWKGFARELGHIAEFGRRNNLCTHVFIHTSLRTTGWLSPVNDIHEKIAAKAREHGLSVTDSRHAHLGRNHESLVVNRFDPHPNPDGHAILASSLFKGIAEDLPEVCWSKLQTE